MRSLDRPILIVDDNRDTRDGLAELLELRGYETVAAHSGEAALRYFREGGQACLVILDIAMPGMSGIELRDTLSSEPETTDIPVIAFTAMPDAQYELSNVVAYIRKPMDPEELLRVVDQACGRGP
jgi:CheY-like chemotaxis protein